MVPTASALASCEKLGGFIPVFDTALRHLKRGKTLASVSCPHCTFPVLDTGRRVCFDGERMCRGCVRTFECPPGVICNPLADFVRNSRAGAEVLGTNCPPGGRSAGGGGCHVSATSAAREKLAAVNGAQLYTL